MQWLRDPSIAAAWRAASQTAVFRAASRRGGTVETSDTRPVLVGSNWRGTAAKAIQRKPVAFRLAAGALAVWMAGVALLVWGRRRYQRLTDVLLSSEELGERYEPVSILVPACNEGATIEPAMRSLLTLDYPDLEIIAVNDRSTDDTGAILDRLALRQPAPAGTACDQSASGMAGQKPRAANRGRTGAGRMAAVHGRGRGVCARHRAARRGVCPNRAI